MTIECGHAWLTNEKAVGVEHFFWNGAGALDAVDAFADELLRGDDDAGGEKSGSRHPVVQFQRPIVNPQLPQLLGDVKDRRCFFK